MPTAPSARDRAATMPPGKRFQGRLLHRTTFSLGNEMACYSTTHTESFCGRRDDGQPLVFFLRDPSFPSQHQNKLDFRNISEGSLFSSTHTRDVYSPKDITPQDVLRGLRNRNWTRNREGLAMKEVTNPPEKTLYQSCYHSDHCSTATGGQRVEASGRPTRWHRHHILTGEEKAPTGPGEPTKSSIEREIGAACRWETDCTSLRLN